MELNTVTWKIAAPNNNPFEFWPLHANEEYTEMMSFTAALDISWMLMLLTISCHFLLQGSLSRERPNPRPGFLTNSILKGNVD